MIPLSQGKHSHGPCYPCEEPRAGARGFFYGKSQLPSGLIAKPAWPFIPARESGAFWLFHVTQTRKQGEVAGSE